MAVELHLLHCIDARPDETAQLLGHAERAPTEEAALDGVAFLQQCRPNVPSKHVARALVADVAQARVHHAGEPMEPPVLPNRLEDAIVLWKGARRADVG